MLLNSTAPQKEEEFLRNFARMSAVGAHVVGYPVTKKQIQKFVELGTVSQALAVGKNIAQNNIDNLLKEIEGSVLFEGVINTIDYTDDKAFTTCTLSLENVIDNARLFIKNENLIVWVNDEVVLTCPDLILMLDATGKPVYNGELQEGQNITIIGAPARPLWRTEKGRELFHPRLFGFKDVPTMLLD